ncbi:MAG TPA: hypothetical protein VHB47_25200 [Thermoanaerobaculia bacterium]|jgi:hypothetical protein|nr:hypothetical protein [Thermoanaerobaculia bacterium]
MKKRTIVRKLQDQLRQEIKQSDLSLVAAGKITICGSGSNIHAISGDLAA